MLGYPGLASVGELGSDAAIMPWFLLVTFLRLPLAIWFSQVLDGLTVTGWSSTYCGSLRLSLQHWMTGFFLAQITDMLPSSFVPLEPFSVLPSNVILRLSRLTRCSLSALLWSEDVVVGVTPSVDSHIGHRSCDGLAYR